ncbi:MAG: alpha/beta hydrolase, partial [Dehalococcoidales bacterium]
IAILDDLRIDETNYFGYSLGAQVGYRAAITHANRFNSFIICGMTPYAYPETWVQNTKFIIEAMKESLKGFDVMIEYLEKAMGQTLSDERKAWWENRLQNVDAEAMVQVFTAEMELAPLTNNDLEKITLPVLVYCGADDSFHEGAEESTKHIPNSKFISLPDHDHMSSFNDIDTILPQIKEFLTKFNK